MHRIQAVSPRALERIKQRLVEANQDQINEFFAALRYRLERQIVRVFVIPLYGRSNQFLTVTAALNFLDAHNVAEGASEFRRYEVEIEFSNGDKVQGAFETKWGAREFLERMAGRPY